MFWIIIPGALFVSLLCYKAANNSFGIAILGFIITALFCTYNVYKGEN